MKLSMWILKKWFAPYHPIVSIQSGDTEIEGARVFSSSREIEQQYVYIGHLRDFFPDNDSSAILLIHKNDIMQLDSNSIEDILNELISAFEYYSRYEYMLLTAAQRSNAEQQIVDLSSDILHAPTFIISPALDIIAFSHKFPEKTVNLFWNEFLLFHDLSPEIMVQICNNDYVRHMNQKNINYCWEEPMAAPYSYGVQNSYQDEDEHLIGQFCFVLKHKPEESDFQLTRMILRALNTVRKPETFVSENYTSENILIQSLRNNLLTQPEAERLSALNRFTADHFFIITALPSIMQSDTAVSEDPFLLYLRKELYFRFPASIFFLYKQTLIGCFVFSGTDISPEQGKAKLQSILYQLLQKTQYQLGISLWQQELTHFPSAVKQALDAIHYNTDTNALFCDFFALACRILPHSFDPVYSSRCLHPVIAFLQTYDQQHQTEYLQTLILFLRNERSYLQVARLMYVHKNTIIYRINRILELYPMDLDSADEREYLLYSFRLFE